MLNNNNQVKKTKKPLIIITIIFFILMLTLTFFSKTIRYYLSTKVITNSVSSGSLNFSYNALLEAYSDEENYLFFPLELSKPMLISSIHVQNGDFIEVGKPLITFEKQSYINERNTYINKIQELNNELKLFDLTKSNTEIDYNSIIELNNLEEKLLEIESKIYYKNYDQQSIDVIKREIEALLEDKELLLKDLENVNILYHNGFETLNSVNEIKKQLDKKEKDIAYKYSQIKDLEKKGMDSLQEAKLEIIKQIEKINTVNSYKNNSKKSELESFQRNLIIEKINKERTSLDKFDSMIDNEGNFSSDKSFKVLFVELKEGMSLSSINIILTYTDIDSPLIFRAEVTKSQFEQIETNALCSTNIARDKVEFKIINKKIINDKFYLILSLIGNLTEQVNNYIQASNNSINITLSFFSQYYETLIPNQAIINQKYIFVVENRNSFFGEEQFIKRMEVNIIDSDNQNTAVRELISRNLRIVSMWSGLLSDGDFVILIEK